jgi:hypothetical protein
MQLMGHPIPVKERRLVHDDASPSQACSNAQAQVKTDAPGKNYTSTVAHSPRTGQQFSGGAWTERKPKGGVTSKKRSSSYSTSPVSVGVGNNQCLQQYLSGSHARLMPQPLSPAASSPRMLGVARIVEFDFSSTPRTVQASLKSTSQRGLRLFEDLPVELLQAAMDLLPTFGQRAQLCMVSKTAVRWLEWRSAPPLQLCEETSGINLGDLGARAVALAGAKPQHSSMGELSLGSNNIGNAGAIAIASLLRDGCTIRRLSLRDNTISDAGAYALAAALAVNKSLEELDLWGNNISVAGKEALVASAKCKVFLELDPAVQPSAWIRLADGRMRAVLFEWVSQVQTGAHGALDGNADPQDLLFRTFNLIDAYFTRKRVKRSELQLIAVAATLAATSMGIVDASHETQRDDDLAAWLAFVTDGAYTADKVKATAGQINKVLGCKMHTPTAYTFLRRYLRKTGWTQESFSFANYLTELAVMNGSLSWYPPQAIAAAATVLSRQYSSQGIGYQNIHSWKEKLLQCSGLDVATELAPCVAALSRLHGAEHGRDYRFVNKKYTWHGLHMVARIKPNPPADAAFFTAYLSIKEVPSADQRVGERRNDVCWIMPEAGQISGAGSPQ